MGSFREVNSQLQECHISQTFRHPSEFKCSIKLRYAQAQSLILEAAGREK